MHSELIQRLLADANLLSQDIAGLSEADLDARPVTGQWTIRELVWHVVDSDIILGDRMRRIIAEDRPSLIGFDETLFTQRLFYQQRDLGPAVKLFELNRLVLADILGRLQPSDFDRVGIHSEVGPLTLLQLLEKTVAHPLHHHKFLVEKRRLLGKPLTEN
jgi:exonuclease I